VREPSYSPLRPCKQTRPGSMLKVLSRMETSLCSSFLLVRPSYPNAHFPVLSQIPRASKIRQRGFREPTLRVPRTRISLTLKNPLPSVLLQNIDSLTSPSSPLAPQSSYSPPSSPYPRQAPSPPLPSPLQRYTLVACLSPYHLLSPTC